jgi:hypothetical protein
MSGSDDGPGQLGDPAFPADRQRVRQELEHVPASTGQLWITVLPRLLAVEVLLAEPEALQDDGLESCLYVLRDRLRGVEKS